MIIKRLNIFAFFLYITITNTCSFTNGSQSVQVQEYESIFSEATTLEQQYEALNQIERLCQNLTGEEEDKLNLFLGHRYYSLNNIGKASYCFEKASQTQPDACRMLGQISLVNGDYGKANTYYERLRNIVFSSEELYNKNRYLLAESYKKSALGLQLTGDFEASTKLRDQLLELPEVTNTLSSQEKRILYTENARDYTKLGIAQKAVDFYDRVFKEFPDYGLDNGDIVNLQHERIDAFCLPRTDPNRIEMIRNLWENQEYENYSQLFIVGHNLSRLYIETNKGAEAVNILTELLYRLDNTYESFSDKDKNDFLELIYQNTLMGLGDYYQSIGSYTDAENMYQRIIDQFPNIDYYDSITKEIDYCFQNAVENQLLSEIENLIIDTQNDDSSNNNDNEGLSTNVLMLQESSEAELFILNVALSKINNYDLKKDVSLTYEGNLFWDGYFNAINGTKLYNKVDGKLQRLRYTEEDNGDAYRLPDKMNFPIEFIVVDDSNNIFSMTIKEINDEGVKLEVSVIKETIK